ncbi:hypothetical protein SBA7_1750017 [Candidatus Sulfotelmatobacter sp. SbA7]|nr:hypothetical protein SBA7_1750017 [Candidatus Sulfotelmatobacter sp. SbA7]
MNHRALGRVTVPTLQSLHEFYSSSAGSKRKDGRTRNSRYQRQTHAGVCGRRRQSHGNPRRT